jgi:hypothetical protein
MDLLVLGLPPKYIRAELTPGLVSEESVLVAVEDVRDALVEGSDRRCA